MRLGEILPHSQERAWPPRRSPPAAPTIPSGISTSSSAPAWPRTPTCAAAWSSSRTATPSGRRCSAALDRMFKDTGHVNAYFPLFIPKSFLATRRADGRGLRQGVRRRHALPPQGGPRQGHRGRSGGEARRGADRPADLRDDHLAHLQELDPELPRPAAAHQPVVQRGALGDAHAAVPAHRRVPLAGGPHRPRHAAGGGGRDEADGRSLPHVRRGVDGDAGAGRARRARARSSPAPSTRSASRR